MNCEVKNNIYSQKLFMIWVKCSEAEEIWNYFIADDFFTKANCLSNGIR